MNYIFKITTIVSFLVIACSPNNKKNDSDVVFKVDTLAVKIFLANPINSSDIRKEQLTEGCKLIENSKHGKIDLELQFGMKEFYSCSYKKNREQIGYLEHSVFKTDSTWALGTNGYRLINFETSSKELPLKFGLNVGSSVEDFEKYFGRLPVKENKCSFEFNDGFETFLLELESLDNIINKISISSKGINKR